MGMKEKFLIGAWNIGIMESSIDQVFQDPGHLKIRWLKHKYRDRFFADPFLLGQDDKYYYILAEEYLFYDDRGKITCLTVDKKTMQLVRKEIILDEEHHLSYPFVYGDHIIPEGYKSGALYAYKKLHDEAGYQRIKLWGEGLVDPTLLQYDDHYWIFATTKKTTRDAVSKLSIYFSDQLGEFKSHANNPVKIDPRSARPAGQFFRYQGKLYRPVMDCEKSYGRFIRIMEVKRLSINEFEEQEVLSLSGVNTWPYTMGFHTFNVYDGFILVDGYREYYDYLRKPFFVKFKKLLLYLNNHFDNRGKEIIR